MQITTATRTVEIEANTNEYITYRNVKDGVAYGPSRAANRLTAEVAPVTEVVSFTEVAPVAEVAPVTEDDMRDVATRMRSRVGRAQDTTPREDDMSRVAARIRQTINLRW